MAGDHLRTLVDIAGSSIHSHVLRSPCIPTAANSSGPVFSFGAAASASSSATGAATTATPLFSFFGAPSSAASATAAPAATNGDEPIGMGFGGPVGRLGLQPGVRIPEAVAIFL